MRVMGVRERFACRVTGQHRTTQRHELQAATLADPDARAHLETRPVRAA
jgi:hypothetical protein